jgi:hypothetical protein
MREDLLEGRSQSVEAPPELMEVARPDPAGELTAYIARINLPRQQQTRFEDWLVADDFEKLLEFHLDNLPKMANWRNESSPAGLRKELGRR